MSKKVPSSGRHLTLDGHGCDQERLANLDAIYEFLEHCPDYIQMTKVIPPYVFKYHGPAPEDWGVSGFVLISESHISIHTYPERGYLSLDIFSVKEFDYRAAVNYATESFGIKRSEVNVLDRSQEFPTEIATVVSFLKREREEMRKKPIKGEPPDECA